MKKFVCAFLFLEIVVLGCGSEEKLVFEPHQMQWEICEKCPKVEVDIPRAQGPSPTARTINNALEDKVIYLLPFSKDGKTNEEDNATTTAGSDALEQEAAENKTNWETKIKGEVVYEDEHILTVMLSAYTYTGGTQGQGSITYMNFNKKKGKVLENQELFEDLKEFEKFAETQFRKRENIPTTGSINATGFKFKSNTFHLPKNVGYTAEGLQLIYNSYEVASYEEGLIVLTLPYNQVNPYLKRKVDLD